MSTPSQSLIAMLPNNISATRSQMIITWRLRNLSTQAPAGRPKTSQGNHVAAVSAAISNVPAWRTLTPTRGITTEDTALPTWLVDSPIQKSLKFLFPSVPAIRRRRSPCGPSTSPVTVVCCPAVTIALQWSGVGSNAESARLMPRTPRKTSLGWAGFIPGRLRARIVFTSCGWWRSVGAGYSGGGVRMLFTSWGAVGRSVAGGYCGGVAHCSPPAGAVGRSVAGAGYSGAAASRMVFHLLEVARSGGS